MVGSKGIPDRSRIAPENDDITTEDIVNPAGRSHRRKCVGCRLADEGILHPRGYILDFGACRYGIQVTAKKQRTLGFLLKKRHRLLSLSQAR